MEYLNLLSGGSLQWNSDTYLTRQASGSLYLGTTFNSVNGSITTGNVTANNLYGTNAVFGTSGSMGWNADTYLTRAAGNTLRIGNTNGGNNGVLNLGTINVEGSTSGSAIISASGTGGTLYLGSANATITSAGALTVTGCTGCGSGGGGSMVYPGGTGIPEVTGGAAWGSTLPLSTFLQTANNLSDLGSASTARTNLGMTNTPRSLTTIGTSGAATLSGGVLNIPQYTGGGSTGISNANFMFVGDSITCGVDSTSLCATSPITIASNGLSATTTGTASSGSTALTVASATGIGIGELVIGAGIPPGDLITAISGTSITLSVATTAALSSTSVSFGNMDYPSQAMRRAALTGNGNTGTNVGVPGWRTDQVIADYTTHVHPLSPAVTGKPGYLFVMMGTNDLLQEIGPVATTEANLLAYWRTALADGWNVTAMTILPSTWSGDQWDQWIQINSFIRAQGAVWNHLIDWSEILPNNYDPTFFASDAIHPLNAGYSLMAQLVNTEVTTQESVQPAVQLFPISTAAGNYFLPVGSGALCTTCSNDAAVGFQAMRFATTDYNDAAFGQGALLNASGSHDNTAMGHYTSVNVSTGYNNSSLGSFACNAVTTGNGNVCLGANADLSATASGRAQIGGGTNGTDNTLQFQGFNFLDNNGNATFNTVKVVAARKGTFVCTAGGTITIANSNELVTSDVVISLNTAAGTISTVPAMKTVTSGTGFTVLCGAADTSTYNYDILN
jgi:lysophospholipase L1-like esterase